MATGTSIRFPAGPYQAWLRTLRDQEHRRRYPNSRSDTFGHREVAERIGVTPKQLSNYLNPNRKWVSELTVHETTVHEGSATVDELYPDGADTVCVPVPFVDPAARVSRCRTPRCRQSANLGGRFCPSCTERLAGIRELYLADAQKVKDSKNRKDRRATCCRVGCWESRLPSERFCETCQAAGHSESDYE